MLKRIFLILSICVFASSLGDGIVSPLLPLYIKDMGVTGIWLGIVVAATFVSNSIAVPIIGRLSDRKARKPFLAAGFLAAALISLTYIWAKDAALLTAVRFVHGAIGALIAPIALAYLGDLSPAGEEGKWMGYSNASFFSGFGLGPFVGGLLSEHFGMTASFLTMSSLNAFAFLVAFIFLPEVKHRKEMEKEQVSLKELSGSNTVRGLFSFRMAQALGFGSIQTFLPIFAAAIGLRTSTIGMLLSINILAVTLFTPPVGILADRVSRRLLTVLGGVLLSLFLATIPMAGSFWPLLLILLAQGLSSSLCVTASSAIIVEEGRRFGMGTMMSMQFLAQGIGMALGPIVSGGIAEALGANASFISGGIISLLGTLAFFWFTRKK